MRCSNTRGFKSHSVHFLFLLNSINRINTLASFCIGRTVVESLFLRFKLQLRVIKISFYQMKIKVLRPFARPSTIAPTSNLTDIPSTQNYLILLNLNAKSPIRFKKLPNRNQIQM